MMKAEKPLDCGTERALEVFGSEQPQEPEKFFHYLWHLNAYARYQCFLYQDYEKSMDITLSLLGLANKLFQSHAQTFDAERKCFSILLILNIARITGYSKKYDLSEARFNELSQFLINPEIQIFKSYPLSAKQELEKNILQIINSLSAENKKFFSLKIQSGLKKVSALREGLLVPFGKGE